MKHPAHVCPRCPFRSPPPYDGVMLCTVSGQNILTHVSSGECPKGFFTPGMGDRLAALLKRVGIKRRKGCGCAKRQDQLNRIGARLRRILSRAPLAASEATKPQ
jgi:hypothetical protein